MSHTEIKSSNVRRWWQGLCAVACLAATLVATGNRASAQSTTYSVSKRQYKVCNLLIESSADANLDGLVSQQEQARGAENPDPFVFYVADERVDVKPQNWEFVNPLAPRFVTAAMRARWTARDASAGNQYTVGEPLRKNMAAYWEVSLRDASIDDLLQYDLIFITNHRRSAFTPIEREKLRKVVDGGGIVWVDNCGGMRMSWKSPFFLERVQFEDGLPQGIPALPIPDHPLLNSPYQLSFDEIGRMGDKQYRSAITSTVPGDNNNEYNSTRIPPNQETLLTIIANVQGNVTLPYVAVGNYGSGSIIIDAADTGCGINDNVGGINAGSGGNSGAIGGTNFTAADTEDLKFLYNMVAWGSSNNTFRRNNRRSGASFDGIGSALASAWNFVNEITVQFNPTAIVNSKSAPLIVGGTLVVSGVQNGNITIRAYDLNPYNDLDGDGNPDDGYQDLSQGVPYDEVWRTPGIGTATADAQPSAPTYASVLVNAQTGERRNYIYVTAPNGDLIRVEPVRGPNGAYLANPVVAPAVQSTGGTLYTSMPNGVAPSPVFFENRIYQIEPNGQIRCINALTNTVRWVTFQNVPTGLTIAPTGTPTVGFARQTADGLATARLSADATSDLMLYAPVTVTDSATNNGNPTARILPYWLGTRNEITTPGTNGVPAGTLATRIRGSQGNGVGRDQYFMAPGPNTDPASPFMIPQARVYSKVTVDGVDYSAQQEYQNGVTSPTYSIDNINPTTGEVTITPAPPPGTDFLVSVDYDVEYIRLNQNGQAEAPPQYETNPTKIGSRLNNLLDSVRAVVNLPLQTLPTTPAFAPDDTLLYMLTEAFKDNAGNEGNPVTSIMGVNEQGGDVSNSRLRLRFSLFNNLTEAISPADGGDGVPRLQRTVRGVSVFDEAPIVSYLRYDARWPLSAFNRAVRYPNAEPISRLTPVGPPVNVGDVTYFLCYGASERNQAADRNFGDAINSANGPAAQADVAVLMAFRTSPDLVLNLPEPFTLSEGVTLSQADVNSNPTQPNIVEESSSQTTTARLQLDPERGRITVTSLRTQGGGLFSASQSFVVQYTPRAGGTRRTVIIAPTPRNASASYGQPIDDSGQVTASSGGYTPLLWYSVLPGRPTSPATLIGDYLYYTMTRGTGGNFVIALDAKPEATDPTVRIGFGEPLLKTVENLKDLAKAIPDANFPTVTGNHVRPAIQVASATETNAPPVGGRGLLAINSPNGTFAYNAGITLVTENQRLLEVDASAAPQWSLESTVLNQIIGGQAPRYEPEAGNPGNVIIANAPATGRRPKETKTLSKPRLAQRISATDYLINDTGNNRVVRTDRGGIILWNLASFVDAYGILLSGEPTQLASPTDAQGYTVPTLDGMGNQIGYEVHYLIADAGNYRIIEVADYYNARGEAIPAPGQNAAAAGEHVILWTTRTTASEGRRLRFTNVQRFLGLGPRGSAFDSVGGYPYITATVANQTVSQNSQNTGTDTAGGSLVVLNYQPYRTPVLLRNGNNVQVGNLWPTAGNGQTPRETEPSGNGTIINAVEEVQIVVNGTRRAKRIIGPTYFRQVNLPIQGVNSGRERRLFLLCDAEAAYAVEAKQDNTGKLFYDVLWYFGQKQYDDMNRSQQRWNLGNFPIALPKFQPMSVQLLGSGNFLIANGYAGRSPLFESGQFVGEAFEVKPFGLSILANAAYGNTIVGGTYDGFSVPQVGPSATTNQLRQVMGGGVGTGATGLVEQPTSAIRP